MSYRRLLCVLFLCFSACELSLEPVQEDVRLRDTLSASCRFGEISDAQGRCWETHFGACLAVDEVGRCYKTCQAALARICYVVDGDLGGEFCEVHAEDSERLLLGLISQKIEPSLSYSGASHTACSVHADKLNLPASGSGRLACSERITLMPPKLSALGAEDSNQPAQSRTFSRSLSQFGATSCFELSYAPQAGAGTCLFRDERGACLAGGCVDRRAVVSLSDDGTFIPRVGQTCEEISVDSPSDLLNEDGETYRCRDEAAPQIVLVSLGSGRDEATSFSADEFKQDFGYETCAEAARDAERLGRALPTHQFEVSILPAHDDESSIVSLSPDSPWCPETEGFSFGLARAKVQDYDGVLRIHFRDVEQFDASFRLEDWLPDAQRELFLRRGATSGETWFSSANTTRRYRVEELAMDASEVVSMKLFAQHPGGSSSCPEQIFLVERP